MKPKYKLFSEEELKEAVRENIKNLEEEVQLEYGKIDFTTYQYNRLIGIEVKKEGKIDTTNLALQLLKYMPSLDKIWVVTSRKNYEEAINFLHELVAKGYIYAKVLKKIKYINMKLTPTGHIVFKKRTDTYEDLDLPTTKCPYCGYEWTPRQLNPKKCPMCQKWLIKKLKRKKKEEARAKLIGMKGSNIILSPKEQQQIENDWI